MNRAVAEAALERLYYFHESFIRRTLELGKGLVDFIYVAEDLGTQDNLLMSPATWRRFFAAMDAQDDRPRPLLRRQGDAPRRRRHPHSIAGTDRDGNRHAEPHPMALQRYGT